MFGFWLIFVVLVLVIQVTTAGLVTPPEYFEIMREADITSPAFRETMREGYAALAAGYDMSDSANVVRMLISFFINLVVGVVFAVASVVAWKHLAEQSAA
jgi:hypothetical protein